MNELDAFAEQLATKNLSQPDLAIALLWYRDHAEHGVSASTRDLAEEVHDLGLSGKINVSRLDDQLARHPDVVRGESAFSFKLRASGRAHLDDDYSPLLGRRRVKPSDSVVPRGQFEGRRTTWQELVTEINGCYDHGFYDGAAVLARRLVEALIVEAFKAKGHEAAIKKGDGYMLLEELAGVVSSGQYIKLSRSAKPGLEPIRVVGNTAAHSPHHITKRQDVDNVSNHVRVLVSELLNIIDGK
jgi:hypothetical protein